MTISDILSMLLNIFIITIAVEAITEIITTASIFEPLRSYIKLNAYTDPPSITVKTRIFSWLDKLITCGYCVSVWVSFSIASNMNIVITSNKYLDICIAIFLVHRLSNWLHVIYELVRKGRIKSIELNMTKEDLTDETYT